MALVLILFSLFRKSDMSGAFLTVEVAPSGSKIKINGNSAKEGKTEVRHGDVSVEVSRKGFKSVTQSIALEEGDDRYVGIALQSDDSTTSDWYETHEKDKAKAEGISSRVFDDSSENDVEKYPLIKQLPRIGSGNSYRVDYGTSENNNQNGPPRIFITSPSPRGRQVALSWIKTSGWDVSDYKIVFINKEP